MNNDLTGQRFGKRVVLSGKTTAHRRPRVSCICDCGSVDVVEIRKLLAGRSTMCLGCLRGAEHPLRTHGASGSSEYRAWHNMHLRCAGRTNRRHIYEGISIADRWSGSEGFRNFLIDMGPKPTAKHSLDREDNAKGYEPSNCRWATPKQQARNRRKSSVLTVAGQTRTLKEWSETLRVDYFTLRKRVKLGWTPEEVVAGKRETPVDRSRVKLTIEGETKTVTEWATQAGVSKNTLMARIKKLGWAPADAVRGKRKT